MTLITNSSTKNISSEIAAANKDLEFEFIKMYDLSKRPAGSWKGKNRKTFKVLPEDYKTYAILTGEIYVIDCDRPKKEGDPDGLEKFLSLLADLGIEDLEQQTLVVDTPNEGKHYYFKTDKELPSKISNTALGAGIDIRAQDALIVGPGSKGKNRKGEIKEYLISSSTLEIAELPSEIFEALNAPKELTSKKEQDKEKGDKSSVVSTEQKDISAIVSELILAKEGERNSTLYKLSATAGSKGIDENTASRLIYAGISIGLEESEARKTFQSGYKKGVEELNSRNSNLKNKAIPDKYKGCHTLSFYSDSNQKDLLVDEISKKFLYNKSNLYRYDKGQWLPEHDDSALFRTIENRLKETSREITDLLPEKEFNKVEARLASLGDSNKIASVMRALNKSITDNSDSLFNEDPHLALAQNCVIDLRTGEALEFSPDYYMSCKLGAEYRPEVGTDLAEPYSEFIDPEHKGLLLAVLGQALTGHYGQSMLTLIGSGSNGKSLFFQVMGEIFGDYYSYLDSGSFYSSKSDRDSKMSLQEKRLVLVEELCSNPGEIIDTEALKKLVGTPSITGRGIYEKTKTFDNKATIIASSNELPTFSNNKVAFSEERRLLLSSCPFTYVPDPSGPFEREVDSSIEQELYNNKDVRSSILNLIVENSVKYLGSKDKFIKESTPDSIKKSVRDWLSKDEIQEPFLAGFEITGNPRDVVPLFDVYLYFAEETKIKVDNSKIGNKLVTSKFIQSQEGIEVVRDSRRISTSANVAHYKGNSYKIHGPGAQAYHMQGVRMRKEHRR